MKRIHVVGNGAIGSVLISRGIRSGYIVTSHVRSNTSKCTHLSDADGITYQLPEPSLSPKVIAQDTLVILPLKAYQVEQALNDITPHLKTGCSILLLHNGMPSIAWYSSLPSTIPVYMGTTAHAAKKEGSLVTVTGHGNTFLGLASEQNASPDQQKGKDITDVIDTLLPPAKFDPDIQQVIWKKLSINAVINPLTAVNKIKNGALLLPHYDPTVLSVVEEFVAVANSCNIHFTQSQVLDWVKEVATLTAENYSSMYQDIKNKRRTEIDFINGFIVNEGNKKGIDVSTNALLCKQIADLSDA